MLTGAGEFIIVLVIIAVFFGAGRLPDVMESIGRGVKEFEEGKLDGLDDDEPSKP
jgi:TatA/E family protein of Tat protein translocase